MALRMALAKNSRGFLKRQMGTTPSFSERLKVAPMHKRSLKDQMMPKGKAMGDYVPVYVALGMISISVALGFHVIKQQFAHTPGVYLKKSRRETLPELVEPDQVAEESSDFMRKSFFRKVAHIQEFDTPIAAPTRGNPLQREPRVESLKTVGVKPGEGVAQH